MNTETSAGIPDPKIEDAGNIRLGSCSLTVALPPVGLRQLDDRKTEDAGEVRMGSCSLTAPLPPR